MVFSMLVSAAYASTWLISYNVYTSGGTYNPVGKAQEKENATAVTSKINDTGFAQGYRVRVMGCDENGIDPVNRTVYNNYDVAYVFCSEDKYYNIDNVVYNHGHGYVKLLIYPVGGSGTTSGEWSPDSNQTWSKPESAG